MTRVSGMTGVNRIDRITTVWHKIFAGSNFCVFCNFSNDQQKKVVANKNYCKHFSRKNLLQSKYSLT